MGKRKVGRASLYETKWKDRLAEIKGWARDGLIDTEIAKRLGIATGTLYEWKKRYPEFDEVLKKGKDISDYEVEQTLYKRAMGYTYEEVKVIEEVQDGVMKKRVEKTKKLIEPNITAQIFWLKNRKPEDWMKKTAKEYRAEDLQLEKMAVEIERQKAEIERLKSLLEPATTSERLMVDYIDKLERVLADG